MNSAFERAMIDQVTGVDLMIIALNQMTANMERLGASPGKLERVANIKERLQRYRGRRSKARDEPLTLEQVLSISSDDFGIEEMIRGLRAENDKLQKERDLAVREATVWRQAFIAIVENPAVDKAHVTE